MSGVDDEMTAPKYQQSDSEPPCNADTIIGLKEFILTVMHERQRQVDQQFRGIDRRIEEADVKLKDALSAATNLVNSTFAASKEAIDKSEGAIERRFESVNEFRKQLGDQTATFARESEVRIQLRALEDRIQQAIESQHLSTGRQLGISATWAIVVIILTLLISASSVIAVLLLK